MPVQYGVGSEENGNGEEKDNSLEKRTAFRHGTGSLDEIQHVAEGAEMSRGDFVRLLEGK